MKIIDYLKDRYFSIVVNLFTLMFITVLLRLFSINRYSIILIDIAYATAWIVCFIYDYSKRRKFYNYISKKLDELDQKYLITEMIKQPNFIDGTLLLDFLYEIDKSFIDELNKYKYSYNEFKEYIELWCHEIKTPVATSKLIIDNNKNKTTESILEEVDKIDNYIEQILYYARSDYLEKDYIIAKTNLKDVMDNVIKKNKKDILSKHIKINTFNDDVYVESDNKWLEFIINQIITNSIKYAKDNDSEIKIMWERNKNNTNLIIHDNGIGIKGEELNKVFDKGFTGSNGRGKYNSTGIGLYLCKKLCNRLDHNILVSSKENEYTEITIVFPNNSLVDVK